MVERNAAPFRDHLFASGIDSRHLRQDDAGVPLSTNNPANRGRYVAWRQTRGGDLVKQRLEQVIVVAIDDGDVEGRRRQLFGGRKAAESCADNDDAGA